MTITAWPVDAVAGAPEYSGKLARQAMGATLFGATSTRPLGARSGVRPGTPTNTVAVSGSTITIKPHAGVLDLQASASAGPYWYAIDADELKSLTAAHATYPRVDIITVKIDDPAESDGSSVPAVTVNYLAGTAAASPTTPSPATSREMVIATIAVPASGGGSAVATWTAPYLAAAGGIVVVRTVTERDALEAAVTPTTDAPLYVHRKNATSGLNLEYTMDGSTWYAPDASDTGWTALTAAAAFDNDSYYRVKGGFCTVSINCTKDGTVAAGSTVNVGTLPASARPSATVEPIGFLGWMSIGSLTTEHRSFPMRIASTGVIDVSTTADSGSLANGGVLRATITFPVG